VINVREDLSPEAVAVYDMMVAVMSHEGRLGMEECLSVSIAGVERCGDLAGLKSALADLERESLVFPAQESAGWVVRLPLRACEPPVASP
jgi:hypothetical protein